MLWLASIASNIGSWMHLVAAAWLMTSLTSSAALVALLQRDGVDCSDAKAVAEAFDPRQINKMVE